MLAWHPEGLGSIPSTVNKIIKSTEPEGPKVYKSIRNEGAMFFQVCVFGGWGEKIYIFPVCLSGDKELCLNVLHLHRASDHSKPFSRQAAKSEKNKKPQMKLATTQ